MPPRKRSFHDQEMMDSILRLNRTSDETKDCLFRLAANFEAHLKQDENFYSEVKGIAQGQNKIADRLGDYNTQLQIHIAGVNELKEQTKIAREEKEILRKDYEARFLALEERHAKAEAKQLADEKIEADKKETRDRWNSRLKIGTGIISIGTGIIMILKFLIHVL